MTASVGMVRGLAFRASERGPMTEVYACHTTVGKGIIGDYGGKGKRGITLLSAERWVEAIAELPVVLPWYARRANVLIEGLDLNITIGKRLRVGEIELRIWAETRPCALMDEIRPGLRKALTPNMRGGVHGEILVEGAIHIGDAVRIVGSA